MWEMLLLTIILIGFFYFMRCLTRRRKKERGMPIFSVKEMQHTILFQPVLQTTAVFEYERGEQDWMLLKKYYRGRRVTAGDQKFMIDKLKKIPAGNWKDTCYYRMYFQEYKGKEFPQKILIAGHVRYWKCLFLDKGIVLYDHVGGKKKVAYEEMAVLIQKKKMSIILLPAKRHLTVLNAYNFYAKDFELLRELLIKYGNLGLGKR